MATDARRLVAARVVPRGHPSEWWASDLDGGPQHRPEHDPSCYLGRKPRLYTQLDERRSVEAVPAEECSDSNSGIAVGYECRTGSRYTVRRIVVR